MSNRLHLGSAAISASQVAALVFALATPANPALAAVASTSFGASMFEKGCRAGPNFAGGSAGLTDFSTSKSSAILGGARSALEATRAQQQITPLAGPIRSSVFAETARLSIDLPAVDASLAPSTACSALAVAGVQPTISGLAAISVKPVGPDDFLASQRIKIKNTLYDPDWRRVRSESLSRAALGRTVGKVTGAEAAKLATVNRWVNRRITYVEDRDLFGRADFWAGAKRTLQLGRGDCEDIALVKMQLLAASGIPRTDMFLTVTRDLARNQDHAVLIVRTGASYFILDDSTDAVLDAMPQNDYRAIVSLGFTESWLHGV